MRRTRASAWTVLCLLLASLLLSAGPASASEAPLAARHWAADAAADLEAKLGWKAPPDLDAAMPVMEWNGLVARLAGVLPGDADPKVDQKRAHVWTYTGGMARNTYVIRREDAIGGLMKLTYLLYGEENFHANLVELEPYADKQTVADYQRTLVAAAIKHGLVTGYPTGLLHPTRPLRFGEGAALVARMLAKYGAPAEALAAAAREPVSQFPTARGFAAGWKDLKLPIDQVIHAGWPVGSAGTAWWVINGAAYATELPGLGAAPAGKVWVAVDTEIYNWDQTELTLAPDSLRFTLSGELPATPTPFEKATVVLKQRESLRGMVIFAAKAGAVELWIQCDSKLGLAAGKGGWNGSSRVLLGNISLVVGK